MNENPPTIIIETIVAVFKEKGRPHLLKKKKDRPYKVSKADI